MKQRTIYVFANQEHEGRNVYKIGSTRDVRKRRRSYLTYWPLGCDVKYTVKTHNGWDAEKLVHKKLAAYRYGRYGCEFFKCNLETICHTIDKVVNTMAEQFSRKPLQEKEKEKITKRTTRRTSNPPVFKTYRYIEVSSGDDSGETDDNSTDSDYEP